MGVVKDDSNKDYNNYSSVVCNKNKALAYHTENTVLYIMHYIDVGHICIETALSITSHSKACRVHTRTSSENKSS